MSEVKAWVKHKLLKLERVPTYKEIIDLAKSIRDMRDRALFILTYITAGRITELVIYREIEYEYHMEEIDGRLKRVNHWDKKNIKSTRYGIKKSDIELNIKEGERTLIIRLQNRKNRERKIKILPINPDAEKELIDLLMPYIIHCPQEVLFPIHRHRAYQIISSYGFNPHYLRVIRLTHLVTIFDFNDQMLTWWAGWTDSKQAKHYINMKWGDVRKKMEEFHYG